MSKIDDGGPAFPLAYEEENEYGVKFRTVNSGMHLRDYIAVHVLTGAMANNLPTPAFLTIEDAQNYMAKLSYGYADALLRARQETVA